MLIANDSNCFTRALTAAVIASAALCLTAHAQAQVTGGDYPSRVVRLIVAGTPGGTSDAVGRTMATRFSERWKHPVVVENHSGASGGIAISVSAKAAPDGYTLSSLGASTLVSLTVDGEAKRGINFKTAFAPITLLVSQPYVFVINPKIPASNIKELVAYAKANPGKLNYASFGENTSSHLGMELFATMVGVDMVHVPYKATNAILTDLMAGRIHALLGGALSSMPLARAGKLRALGVTSSKRSQYLSELPTVAEAGVPGYSIEPWFGLVAPAGTAPSIINLIHRDALQILSSADLKEKFGATGTEVTPSATPAEFGLMLEREVDRWEKFSKDRIKR